jgi:RNA polymerase sigma-70 factor (ECF subfamily)
MTDELSDQKIVMSIREGNAVVFQQVFDACYESLCQYAFTMLRDENEAEDTVQSMFMKLWSKREELDIKQSIRSYLFRSVYNQCMNQIEHKAVKQKHFEHSKLELTNTVQPDVFPDELEDKIREAVDALPPQCRAIFIMSRYEELRYPEIAEKLNISVNTIQNQICKALKILREKLKDII